ncbi:hypothetical protein [Deinococcus radiophilus]|uniref:Uncharacterized protein n=1 Tax=Deinococcus radiophilus TaxID=32062 RepID=A0A3S0I6J2_9DEIO|nr:hypothetical protein [Deinococcus radiophilus]RTR28634.1 hypothetical protein EJ104_04580 [Deinococcus radiophilus]UFA51057.1 hypothetical protein LMT64_03930 [Deinococcus radiophilus]
MPEGDNPTPARTVKTPRRAASAKAMPSVVELPQLYPRFREVQPFLARFLPDVAPSQLGLHQSFCDLYVFLSHLQAQGWSGYLHSSRKEQNVWVLLLRGRPVSAAADTLRSGAVVPAESIVAEEALGELILSYQVGAELAAYPLPAQYAELLSGLGNRAQKFDFSADFNGLYAQPTGAVLYAHGEAVATLDASLPYEGAFPVANPQPLVLPRNLVGWAHATYQPTLRGRDVLSPITAAHAEFRAEFGTDLAPALIQALIRGVSPAEFALEHDTPLTEIEPWLGRFKEQGYLVR